MMKEGPSFLSFTCFGLFVVGKILTGLSSVGRKLWKREMPVAYHFSLCSLRVAVNTAAPTGSPGR